MNDFVELVDIHCKGKFPREFGKKTKRSFIRNEYATSPETLARMCEFFDYEDCFVSVYSFEKFEYGEPWDRSTAIIDRIYIDLDCEENLRLPLKEALKIIDWYSRVFGVYPLVYFTGSKGFAVYLDFKPVKFRSSVEAKNALRLIATLLVEQLELKTLDIQVMDIARLSRIPLTLNTKSNLYCIPLNSKKLDKLALSIGKHTIKVIATDNTGAKSSKVTIVNVVHKEPEIKLCYDPDIPYFVKEIPVKVYINSPEKGLVFVKVNSKLEKSKKVEAFKLSELPFEITDLPNKYNAKKTYEITITLKTDSATKTYTRYVTLKRTAEFKRGSKFNFYVKVDKGYGHTKVWIEYDGRIITPSQPMPELNAWERKIADIPFKITARKSGFVKVVAENEAGRDEKTLYLQVGNVQTPTVTPTPTPTPTPIPTPTPTPTVPASYEACYVQVNGGGANKDDSGGIGYAEAWVAGNEIHVLARQEGGGLRPSVAEGYVYSDFEYDVPTHNAKVTVKYYVSGSMFVIGVGGVGETSYYVKVELIDLTTGKTLGVKEHGDSYSLNVINLKQKVIDETITDTFNVKLIKGHKYRVKIYAKVTAKALGFGGTMSNFAEWDFSGKTRLIKFESVCLKWT